MDEREHELARLMNEHGPNVWKFLYSLTNDRVFTDDLSQEVFVRVYTSLGSFRGESSIKTWIFSIARNVYRDYVRSLRRRPTFTSELSEAIPSPENVEDKIQQVVERDVVLSHLLSLKRIYREVIILHVYIDMSFSEIACILDKSQATVRTRYRRGLEQLRIRLEKEMVQYES